MRLRFHHMTAVRRTAQRTASRRRRTMSAALTVAHAVIQPATLRSVGIDACRDRRRRQRQTRWRRPRRSRRQLHGSGLLDADHGNRDDVADRAQRAIIAGRGGPGCECVCHRRAIAAHGAAVSSSGTPRSPMPERAPKGAIRSTPVTECSRWRRLPLTSPRKDRRRSGEEDPWPSQW